MPRLPGKGNGADPSLAGWVEARRVRRGRGRIVAGTGSGRPRALGQGRGLTRCGGRRSINTLGCAVRQTLSQWAEISIAKEPYALHCAKFHLTLCAATCCHVFSLWHFSIGS